MPIVAIDDENIKEAEFMSRSFVGDEIKNRTYINSLSAEVVSKYLQDNNIECTLSNLHTISKIIEKLDIADIILPNISIDARPVINSNYIAIPKSHYEYNIVPDVYVVVNFDEDYKNADLIGYIIADNIDKSKANDKYYFVEKANLLSMDNFISYVKDHKGTEEIDLTEEDLLKAREYSVTLADHSLSDKCFKELLDLMKKNESLRNSILEFDNFERLSYSVAPIIATFEDEEEEETNIAQDNNSETETPVEAIAPIAEAPTNVEEVSENITETKAQEAEPQDNSGDLSILSGNDEELTVDDILDQTIASIGLSTLPTTEVATTSILAADAAATAASTVADIANNIVVGQNSTISEEVEKVESNLENIDTTYFENDTDNTEEVPEKIVETEDVNNSTSESEESIIADNETDINIIDETITNTEISDASNSGIQAEEETFVNDILLEEETTENINTENYNDITEVTIDESEAIESERNENILADIETGIIDNSQDISLIQENNNDTSLSNPNDYNMDFIDINNIEGSITNEESQNTLESNDENTISFSDLKVVNNGNPSQENYDEEMVSLDNLDKVKKEQPAVEIGNDNDFVELSNLITPDTIANTTGNNTTSYSNDEDFQDISNLAFDNDTGFNGDMQYSDNSENNIIIPTEEEKLMDSFSDSIPLSHKNVHGEDSIADIPSFEIDSEDSSNSDEQENKNAFTMNDLLNESNNEAEMLLNIEKELECIPSNKDTTSQLTPTEDITDNIDVSLDNNLDLNNVVAENIDQIKDSIDLAQSALEASMNADNILAEDILSDDNEPENIADNTNTLTDVSANDDSINDNITIEQLNEADILDDTTDEISPQENISQNISTEQLIETDILTEPVENLVEDNTLVETSESENITDEELIEADLLAESVENLVEDNTSVETSESENITDEELIEADLLAEPVENLVEDNTLVETSENENITDEELIEADLLAEPVENLVEDNTSVETSESENITDEELIEADLLAEPVENLVEDNTPAETSSNESILAEQLPETDVSQTSEDTQENVNSDVEIIDENTINNEDTTEINQTDNQNNTPIIDTEVNYEDSNTTQKDDDFSFFDDLVEEDNKIQSSDTEISNIQDNENISNENKEEAESVVNVTQGVTISDKTCIPGEIQINQESAPSKEEPSSPILENIYNEESTINDNKMLQTPSRISAVKVENGNKKVILSITAIMIVLFVTVIGFFGFKAFNQKSNDETPQPIVDEGNSSNQETPNNIATMNDNENSLATPIGDAQNNVNQPQKAHANLEIQKLSWKIPDYLAQNADYQKYFQSAGKSLRLAISSDLLLAKDYSYSDTVEISITFNKDGSLKNSQIVTSSGSTNIDKIIIDSIQRTLNNQKAPSNAGDNSAMAVLKITF